MTQRRSHRESALRKHAGHLPAADPSPLVESSADTGKHCAYNQSRERFLGAEVAAPDFSIAGLDGRLPSLTPDSGAGLWLNPFRGLSPTSVRVPVDLVYLDRFFTVIDTVGSFPISRASSSGAHAASVLVLPADTILSTETRPGDQLIVCPPDEMKRRLQRLANSSAVAEPAAAPVRDEPVRGSSFRLLQWEDHSRIKSSAERHSSPDRTAVEHTLEELPVQPAPVTPEFEPSAIEPAAIKPAAAAPAAAQPAVIEPAPRNVKPARSWLQRLLSPDPPEPRKAARHALPGLAAFFFTGGAPQPHEVRDISSTGMYVFTSERWYPGTMVRMTLTDRSVPNDERSITLNTSVIRAGNDGVGLKFAFQNGKDRHQVRPDGLSYGADRMQVDQFLERLRSANS
ncbi:MAG: PilZ domain-containing protein [Terracidiphilus sp.]